jgi:acyl-CoA thioesterase
VSEPAWNRRAHGSSVVKDFLASPRVSDELTAEARELWRSKRSGIYEIVVSNQRGEPVALFRGRSHCSGGHILP